MEKLYYLSHWLWKKRIPLLPRLIMLFIRFLFQSFIPFDAEIGPGVCFGHKFGIVISRTTRIGSNVLIRHGVTIGSGGATIGNDVQIGTGAALLGNITIGNGARIGANAVVTRSVPAETIVIGIPAKPVSREVLA